MILGLDMTIGWQFDLVVVPIVVAVVVLFAVVFRDKFEKLFGVD